MNLWVDFDLKFDLILQGKMAKISPNIHKLLPIISWPNFVFKVMGQFYTKKDTIKSLRRIDLEFSPRDNTL